MAEESFCCQAAHAVTHGAPEAISQAIDSMREAMSQVCLIKSKPPPPKKQGVKINEKEIEVSKLGRKGRGASASTKIIPPSLVIT